MSLDILAPLLILNFFLRINKLHLFNALALDFVNMVDLTQESRINPMVAKMTMKQDASFFKGLASPEVQGIGRNEELYMFRSQEAITIAFPNRQRLLLESLPPSHYLPIIKFGKSLVNKTTYRGAINLE